MVSQGPRLHGIIFLFYCKTQRANFFKRFKDGTVIKGDERVIITSEEKVYKLEFTEIVMEDAGLYKCTVSNRLGDKSQETNFGTISVNEFRKPTVNNDLKPVIINKNENGTLTLMLVADPVPEIVWYEFSTIWNQKIQNQSRYHDAKDSPSSLFSMNCSESDFLCHLQLSLKVI